jgi:hypothetical protein
LFVVRFDQRSCASDRPADGRKHPPRPIIRSDGGPSARVWGQTRRWRTFLLGVWDGADVEIPTCILSAAVKSAHTPVPQRLLVYQAQHGGSWPLSLLWQDRFRVYVELDPHPGGYPCLGFAGFRFQFMVSCACARAPRDRAYRRTRAIKRRSEQCSMGTNKRTGFRTFACLLLIDNW